MDDKITIIEGPTPVFETIEQVPLAAFQTWSAGLFEGPVLYDSARTTLRTFNSASLIERCNQTWQERSTMYLEYRDRIGLTKQTPIMAAQAHSTEDGDILILWVRKDSDDEEFNTDEKDQDSF